jgi:tetratricopeptide (TPR) repeat protein
VIVSDHRKAPGKKYFTWGSHAQGRLWDNVLSDEDGPYVELQLQAFFDHLNYGYAKLDPMEIKQYTCYWIPVMKTGGFVKASRDMVLNLNLQAPGTARLALQATADYSNCRVSVAKNGQPVFAKELSLTAAAPFNENLKINFSKDDHFEVSVHDKDGNALLYYTTQVESVIPKQYFPERKDTDSYTIDELITQAKANKNDVLGIRAEESYKKILERDPNESRANRELGIIYYERGLHAEARKHLLASLENDHMENSYQTYYFLGLLSREEDKLEEAWKYLVIAGRQKEVKPVAQVELIRISYRKGEFDRGIALATELIEEGNRNPEVYNLLSYGYRKMGEPLKAGDACLKAIEVDPLSFVTYYERWLVNPDEQRKLEINGLFDRRDRTFLGTQLYLETAIDYLKLNDFEAAKGILTIAKEHFTDPAYQYPLVDYYLGYCESNLGNAAAASAHYRHASAMNIRYVFPYRKTSGTVLRHAMGVFPEDATAMYLLGNLYFYHRRHEEAVDLWKKSISINPSNPWALRNYANGIYFLKKDTAATIQFLEKASDLARNDIRILQELDYIYQAAGMDNQRLGLLESRITLVKSSPDIALRLANLYLKLGKYEKAVGLMESTYFPATEGSLGKNIRHSRFAEAHRGWGEELMREGNYREALVHFFRSMEYPDNLNEKEPVKPVYSRVHYLIGLAYEGASDRRKSSEFFELAAKAEINNASEAMYYKALALRKIGQEKKAQEQMQVFSNSLASDKRQPEAVKAYLESLGYRFAGDNAKAEELLMKALRKNNTVILDTRLASGLLSEE